MVTQLEKRLYSALLEEKARDIHWNLCPKGRGMILSGCPDLELHRKAASMSMIHDFPELKPEAMVQRRLED